MTDITFFLLNPCTCCFSYLKVRDLTGKVVDESTTNRPQSPQDLYKLLNVQRGFAHAANSLTSTSSARSTHEVDAGEDMLDYFYSIIDIVIGNDSVDVWKQEVRSLCTSFKSIHKNVCSVLVQRCIKALGVLDRRGPPSRGGFES